MTSFDPIIAHLRGKNVPEHRHTGWYLFGGLTLFLFGVQVLSGVLLSLHYQPSPESANESVTRITGEVPLGWFVRSLHVWSSHLVIFCALVHLAVKFFFRAYRHPRGMTWVSGVLLILILLAFAFTGHLLPWEITGYFATQIGVEISSAVPVIGPLIAGFLRGGGGDFDEMTLTRIYSLHTVFLPFIAFLLAGLHILQSLSRDPASPDGAVIRGQTPFHPDFLYRNALAWLCCSMLLFTLVMYWPSIPGPKSDILATAPPGIRPEWYFLPLYQTLRLFPGSIAGVETTVVVTLGVLAGIAALLALPWIDRGKGRVLRVAGVVFLVYVTGTILMSYTGI